MIYEWLQSLDLFSLFVVFFGLTIMLSLICIAIGYGTKELWENFKRNRGIL